MNKEAGPWAGFFCLAEVRVLSDSAAAQKPKGIKKNRFKEKRHLRAETLKFTLWRFLLALRAAGANFHVHDRPVKERLHANDIGFKLAQSPNSDVLTSTPCFFG